MHHAVEQRLCLIDFLVRHYGYVNRSALIDYFGIGEATASRDFKHYMERAPDNLTFNSKEKAYYKTQKFKAIYG